MVNMVTIGITLRPRLGHALSTTQAVAIPTSTRPTTAAIDKNRHGAQSLDAHDQAFVHDVLTPRDTTNAKATALIDERCRCLVISLTYCVMHSIV